MTWFIFAGDMIVMLFMVGLVIWVFMVTPDSEIDASAEIPLHDEEYESDLVSGQAMKEEAGFTHG